MHEEESPDKFQNMEEQSPDQQNHLQEMDLNVYEDDDDETLRRKLVAAKMARKRAEEDKKLLHNRIHLLKQEENKVRKDLLKCVRPGGK